MKNADKTSRFIWLWVTISVFFIAFHAFSSERMVDPDLWGHLTFGKKILETHTIPQVDPYCYVPTKTPWTNHEWLCATIFAFLYNLSGDRALLFFKALLGGLAFLLIIRIAYLRGANYIVIIFLFPLALYSLQKNVYVRAHLYTYFLFVVFLWILEEYQDFRLQQTADKGPVALLKRNLIFCLPIFTIFWANCHPGFVVGPGVIFIYFLFAARQGRIPLLMVFIASCFAVLVNPFGCELIVFMFKTLTMTRYYITEWRAVPLNPAIFPAYKIMLIFSIFSLIIWALTLYKKSDEAKRRKFFTAAAMLFITTYFSLKYYRHIPLFMLSASAFLPALVTDIMPTRGKVALDSEKLIKPVIASFLFLSLCILLTGLHPLTEWNLTVPLQRSAKSYIFPVDAVNFLEKNNLKGKILCHFDWGEFLIFRLHHNSTVSFDGRLDTVYLPESINMNLDFTFGKEGWRKLINEYPPDLIMVSIRNKSFINMQQEKDWVLIYGDNNCAVFIGKNKGAEKYIYPPRFTTPAIPMKWASKNPF